MSNLNWQTVVELLGWTLVHSVWQAALVSLIVVALEPLMRRSSASVRYGVLLVMLAAMVAVPVSTAALWTDAPVQPDSPWISSPMEVSVDSNLAMGLAPMEVELAPSIGIRTATESVVVERSWLDVARDVMQPWLVVIVGVWSVGVIVCAARPILSWHTVRRLRTVGVSDVPDGVRCTLERTARRLQFASPVRVLQSTLVQVPVVIGYFRPLILLPVSLISGLSVSQWEAILAHELAHIRRHDYLVNAWQTVVETLFFYHPAVWWLSWRIRCERENCCDDVAVAVLGNRVEYSNALLALELLRGSATPLAIGAGGGSLVARVRRLLNHESSERHLFTASVLGTASVATVIVLLGIWVGIQAREPNGAEQAPPSSQREKPTREPGASLDIIVAEHVLLWDGEIVTWEQVVSRLRKMRQESGAPLHPNFRFTNRANEIGKWKLYHDAIFEVYRELFEPLGVSLGFMSPRAGIRYDSIRTAADLVPKPELVRRGVVRNGVDGKIVVGALVVLMPEDSPMPVMLRPDGTLRDPLDEVWTRTDNAGRFEITAPNAGQRLLVLASNGFAAVPVPKLGTSAEISLAPLARLDLVGTPGKPQVIHVTIRPEDLPETSPGFAIYNEQPTEKLSIRLPSGRITVSRSFDQGNGSSISVPAETVSLMAGEQRQLTIPFMVAPAGLVPEPSKEEKVEKEEERDEKEQDDQQPIHGDSAAAKPAANETLNVVTTDGVPSANVEVVAYTRRGDRLWATRTDDQGRFEFRGDKQQAEALGDEQEIVLVAFSPGRLGWFDPSFQKRRPTSGGVPADSNQVKIAMLPLERTLTGRLVDQDRRPIVGVRVQSVRLNHPANSHVSLFGFGIGVELPFPHGVTNADGRFTVSVPLGVTGELRTMAADWVTQSRQFDQSDDFGEIPFVPAGKIAGRVTEQATGKPLAGMRVYARGLTSDGAPSAYGYATTDADGRYLLGGLHPEFYNVQFGQSSQRPQLVAPLQTGVEVKSGQTRSVDFPVFDGQRLHGRVVDAAGQPVPGTYVIASVSLRPNDRSIVVGRMTRANERGEFELFVPPGICQLRAEAADHASTDESQRIIELSFRAGEDRLQARTIELKLGRAKKRGMFGGGHSEESMAATAAGRDAATSKTQVESPAPPRNSQLEVVLRPTAKDSPPIGAHIVRRVFVGRGFVSQTSLRTGARFDEEFRPEEFGRKSVLLIDVPGYTPVTSGEFTVDATMPPLEIDLPPEVLVPVHGRVLDANDRPIAGARVRVRRNFYGTDSTFPWGPEASTNADGHFELKRLRAGEQIILYADRPGVGQAETSPFVLAASDAKGGAERTLRIASPDQTVAGRVTDQDGLPVPNATVAFAGEPKRETTTDAQGNFRLNGLPAGRLNLSLRADDGSQARHFVTAGTTDIRLFLPLQSLYNRPEHRLPVSLRATEGELTRAKYYLLDLTAKSWTQSGEFSRDGERALDLHSERRLHGDHRFALLVLADGFAAPSPVPLVIAPKPEPNVVVLQVAAPVTLRGRVVDESGQSLAGVTIGLSRQLSDEIYDDPWSYIGSGRETLPVTADDGTFSITGLHQGLKVAVYVNQPDRAGAWSQRILLDGPTATLPDIVLRKANRMLSGRVVDRDNRPLAGARVRIHDFSRPVTTTNQSGRFEFSSVPNGSLLLVVDQHGFQDRTMRLATEDLKRDLVVQLDSDPNQFLAR